MKNYKSVYDESPFYAIFKALTVPSLRTITLRCVKSILYNFFFRQFRAAFLPGRVPVSLVEDPLDQKIPFVPSWVNFYLDFVFFWIRILSFLFHNFKRRSFDYVRDFIVSIGKLYAFAADSYKKNFSTTKRPFYIKRPRFFLIHMVDPHLMCIPSLHIMLVIFTYTRFRKILRSLNQEETHTEQIEELQCGAIAITHAVLYVKQHSINCIAAALYAMTCFDKELFPVQEAEKFTALLFQESGGYKGAGKKKIANYKVRPEAAPKTKISAEDAAQIRAHILNLYYRFMEEGKEAKNWEEPLLNFMRQMPSINYP